MNSLNSFRFFLFSALLVFFLFNQCAAQQDCLVFEWQNSNPFPVTFDVFEVMAPPDTSVIIKQLNSIPIPDLCVSCFWSTPFTFDDSLHYFRVRSVRYDSLCSRLSSTAFLRAHRYPESPYRLIIIQKSPLVFP